MAKTKCLEESEESVWEDMVGVRVRVRLKVSRSVRDPGGKGLVWFGGGRVSKYRDSGP